jgi:caa(3)-type oxidase subunit IV
MTHDVAVQVKGYMVVFATLFVLTVVTVAVSYLHLPHLPAVAVALTIAGVKATLVALFFMHLKSERGMVYMALTLTAVLFVVLFSFTLWTEADHPAGARFVQPFDQGIRIPNPESGVPTP